MLFSMPTVLPTTVVYMNYASVVFVGLWPFLPCGTSFTLGRFTKDLLSRMVLQRIDNAYPKKHSGADG